MTAKVLPPLVIAVLLTLLVGTVVYAAVAADDDITATVQTQDQARARLQVHDPGECDGTGPQQGQARLHAGARGQTRGAAGGTGAFGIGPRDGAGPLHEGPADGTGNQFGRQGA